MSGIPFDKEHLAQLEAFVTLCKVDPKVLNHADLAFFKNYIESLGGKIPGSGSAGNTGKPTMEDFVRNAKPQQQRGPAKTEQAKVSEPEAESDSEESELELDTTGVLEPDTDEAQQMGDTDKTEVAEEDIEKANEIKGEAMSAYCDGDYEKAVKFYSEAIILNPLSALQFAKRGQCYLMLKKPNACIRDCTRALEINPDNAAAYKFRGRANRLLGRWEEASADLGNACKIDYDEQADEWLREVAPNAKKIVEHRRKYERRREERELKEKIARAKRAREEHARAREESSKFPGASSEDKESDFYSFLKDPDIMTAFQDPEVAAAFQDISANPANIRKYQNNPKVSALINKMATTFGGAMPGGMGSGFGAGFPGATFPPGPPPNAGGPPPPSSGAGDGDDGGVELD